MIRKALNILALLKSEQEKIDAVNNSLREIDGGDFPIQLSAISSKLETAIVSLLDEILEPEAGEAYAIASYWLYEEGGLIIMDEVEYPIKTIEDVEKYVKAIERKRNNG